MAYLRRETRFGPEVEVRPGEYAGFSAVGTDPRDHRFQDVHLRAGDPAEIRRQPFPPVNPTRRITPDLLYPGDAGRWVQPDFDDARLRSMEQIRRAGRACASCARAEGSMPGASSFQPRAPKPSFQCSA